MFNLFCFFFFSDINYFNLIRLLIFGLRLISVIDTLLIIEYYTFIKLFID